MTESQAVQLINQLSEISKSLNIVTMGVGLLCGLLFFGLVIVLVFVWSPRT